MNLETLAVKAAALRDLHHAQRPLVLANAWDAASAQLVEAAGFPVIATSSGAIAASLGFPDDDSMPPQEAFGAVARIVRVISRPLTADVEAGYQLEPEKLVAQLLGAEAVGCNIEDTDHHGPDDLVDRERQSERLGAIKRAADVARVNVVLNARIDVFRGEGEPSDEDFDEALGRARSYLAAGADCVFPIRLSDERMIGELVQQLQAPVNILMERGSPSLARLAELGVARVSQGGRLMRSAYATLQTGITELREALQQLD